MQRIRRNVVLLASIAFPVLGALSVSWPPDHRDLLFAWPTALEPAHVSDSDGNPRHGWQFTPHGYGRLDHHGALVLDQGGFYAEGLEASLAGQIRQSGGLTLWLTAYPALSLQQGAILQLGDEPLIKIAQQENQIRCEFRTASQAIELTAPLPKTAGHVSIGLSWSASSATLFIDGSVTTAEVPAAIQCGETVSLALGIPSSSTESGWKGAVEGLAIFARALDVTELTELKAACDARVAGRSEVPAIKVRARLAGKSTVTPPRELAPYTQGLCVFRYDILETLEGEYAEKHAHVAHWSVLDQALLPFMDVEEGTEHVLTLELLDDNPQLTSENLSDDIVDDFSLPYFYDAGGCAIEYKAPGR